MKNLRQVCAGVILVLAFAFSAYGDEGHVPCGLAGTVSEVTLTGDIPYPVVELTVSIIQNVLSLS